MSRTFKALSALLCYPSVDLKEATGVIGDTLRQEQILSQDAINAIQPLIDDLANMDIYDLQERFVMLFDRSRTLSLNLFEHVHGESRDRGGAMVSLVETYRDSGFDPVTSELPDHLPVLLEFLATQTPVEARDTLADAAHIFQALAERLERRESSFGAVFVALLQLSGAEVDAEAVAEMLEQPDDDPTDLEALDKVWEESEVVFGPDPNAGCPQVRDMLARMDEVPKPASISAAE